MLLYAECLGTLVIKASMPVPTWSPEAIATPDTASEPRTGGTTWNELTQANLVPAQTTVPELGSSRVYLPLGKYQRNTGSSVKFEFWTMNNFLEKGVPNITLRTRYDYHSTYFMNEETKAQRG